MIQQIKYASKSYPSLLKEIQDPPNQLHILGSLPDPALPCIAIVGTRKATREGLLYARRFARELAEEGFVIVSGLALGIDGSAHEGALEANGKTIAVLANGLNSIYPRQHQKLAERIIQHDGCIISEYGPDTPPYPNQFLERNRIVAGISKATLLIECPIRSGSLATARLAIESGRDVFILPGPTANKNYEGSHMLIRTGARLITKTEDILEDLGIEKQNKKEQILISQNETVQKIISALKSSTKPLRVDTIIEMTHLEPDRVQEELTLLALDGIINDSGGSFTINE